jgi:hypothetical protein
VGGGQGERKSKVKPVGRIRRIVGIVVATYGGLVMAWNGWVVADQPQSLNDEQWLRFGFVLWMGSVLVLFGLWLAFRSRLCAIGTVLAFLVPPAIVLIIDWL